MKTSFTYLIILLMLLSAFGCTKRVDVSKHQILLHRLSELQEFSPSKSAANYDVHYKIGFASRSSFDGYLIYRIVSRVEDGSHNEHSVLEASILEKGVVDDLEIAKSDRRIKEMDYKYTYNIKDVTFGESPTYSRYSFLEKMDTKKRPCNLEIIRNRLSEGSTIYHDTGVIMYQLPFPKDSMKTHEDYEKAYQIIKDNHTFNLDSFALNPKYLTHIRDITSFKQESNSLFHYYPYITY